MANMCGRVCRQVTKLRYTYQCCTGAQGAELFLKEIDVREKR